MGTWGYPQHREEVSMTDYTPTLEINNQDGYADIVFVNPKTQTSETVIRLNPRELIMTRDLLNKHFPIGSEPK